MATYEKHHNLNVWWFPREFCQSRYGEYRNSGTNSCTLISLILADKVAKEHFLGMATKKLPRRVVEIFSDAINEGNIVYSRIFNANERNVENRTPNLNIPEAIAALCDQENMQFDLQEWFYTHLTANPHKETYEISVPNRITQVLQLGIQLFRQSQSNTNLRNLFAAIIADSRTCILIFEFPNNIVSFFDSHQHGHQAGAVMAQSSFDNLLDLTHLFVSMLKEIFSSRPSIYEISFLIKSADAQNLSASQRIN